MKTKKLFLLLVGICLVLMLTTLPLLAAPSATTTTAKQPIIKIRNGSYVPPTHFQALVEAEWQKWITDRSGGDNDDVMFGKNRDVLQ